MLHPLGAGWQQCGGGGAAAGRRGGGNRGAARLLPGLRGAARAGQALRQRAPQHWGGLPPAARRHPPWSPGMLRLRAGERQPPASGQRQHGVARRCLWDRAGGLRAGSQRDAGDAAGGGGRLGGVLPRTVPAAGAAAAAALGRHAGHHAQRRCRAPGEEAESAGIQQKGKAGAWGERPGFWATPAPRGLEIPASSLCSALGGGDAPGLVPGLGCRFRASPQKGLVITCISVIPGRIEGCCKELGDLLGDDPK